MNPLLSANKVSQSFGPKPLFSDLSFSVHKGDRIGLLGPNGAGKSSLLKILAQHITPDTGEVFVSRGLKVGYLAQAPHFNDETVEAAIMSAAEDPNDASEFSRAEELISRLGLNQGSFKRTSKLRQLSGGQQKRVALARELMKTPDVLLLDEPTNHLDIESLLWLEEFLIQPSWTLVVVTHDRLFLQNVANTIIDLDPQYKDGLLRVEGNYSSYLETRATTLQAQLSEESSRANDLRREMSWLQRGARARSTKAKARIQKTHKLKDEVDELRSMNRKKDLKLTLHSGDKLPKQLVRAKGISKRYDEQPLFQNLDLTIGSGSRIALLGKNGCGKTTLVRCLLGQEAIDTGSIEHADHLSVNYFDQSRDSLDPEKTVLENLCSKGEYVSLAGTPIFAASYLDRFRFHKDQIQRPLKTLSGGEQARLLIAKMMLKESAILVLDEPTNDLDIETLDVLRDTIREYRGAVLLVTHDRFFMEQVCDSIIAFPEPEDLADGEAPGTLERFESYLQWQNWKMERKQQVKKALKSPTRKPAAKKKQKMSYKEVYELENMESKILEKESRVEQLNLELSKPEVASNPDQLIELTRELSETEKKVEKLYTRWSELEQKANAFEA